MLLFTGAASGPTVAQYIGAPPPPPAASYVGLNESPAAALSRNLRLIALNPRDFSALVAAGRAALDLGDHQAAVGFFARAEELNPSAPAPKIGMGAATVQMGDALGALSWFAQAQQLGASAITLGADRGLAQDLLGNSVAAQNDYRAALGGPDRDEARRRLALSLAISRDSAGATAILQPLLNRRDPGAQRVRAFVLALGGDHPGARRAIEAAMPGAAARIDPFFLILPRLTVEQKAAAVHLGVFPIASEIKLAAIEPVRQAVQLPQRQRPARRPSTKVAPPKTEPLAVGRRVIGSSSPITTVVGSGVVQPTVAAPVASSIVTATPTPAPVKLGSVAPSAPVTVSSLPPAAPVKVGSSSSTAPVTLSTPPDKVTVSLEPVSPLPSEARDTATASLAVTPPEPPDSAAASLVTTPPASTLADMPTPGFSAGTGLASIDRLSGLEKLLAEADEASAPPPSRRKVERAAAVPTTPSPKKADAGKPDKKKAEAKRLADEKKAAAKRLAEEKKEREAIGVAGTNWVQLAGGANADRMGVEFRKLAAKSSALRKRGGYVTEGKDYFRLIAGPFASKSDAQAFVNQLAKDGVDGFSWTRTPPTIRIEKIPPK